MYIFTSLYIYAQSDSTTKVIATPQIQFDDSVQLDPTPTIGCAAGAAGRIAARDAAN